MTWNVYPQIKSLYVHVRGLFADSTKKNTSSHIWSSYCGKAIKSNQRLQLRLLKVMVELPPGNPVQSTSVDQGMFYTAHGFTYAMLGPSCMKAICFCTKRSWHEWTCRWGIAQNASLLSKAVEALPYHSHFDSYWLRNAEAVASHAPKTLATSVGSLSFRATLSAPGYSCDINSRHKNGALRFIFVEGQQPRSLPICDIIVAYFWNDAKWLPNVSNKVFSVKLSKSETSLYFR